MKKFRFFAAIFATVLLLSACSKDDAPDRPLINDPQEVQLPVDGLLSDIPSEEIVSTNDFSIDYFKAVIADKKYDNVCIGTTSFYTLISMLANAATEEGRDEALVRLGFPTGENGLKALNTFNYRLLTELPKVDPEVGFNTVNSFWNYSASTGGYFEQMMQSWYHTSFFEPIADPLEAKTALNKFVAENTAGVIADFMGNEDGWNPIVALLNVSYFKGLWKHPFESELNFSFSNLDGTSISTRFLSNADTEYNYYAGEGVKAVKLPYASGSFRMMLIVPDEGVDFKDIVNNLHSAFISKINESAVAAKVSLRMPEFKCNTSLTGMEEMIKAMGLQELISGGFSFTSGALNLALGQQTRIDVNKSGTSASSASEIESNDGMAQYHVIADRPFIYLIEEKSTGAILFMGAVTNF